MEDEDVVLKSQKLTSLGVKESRPNMHTEYQQALLTERAFLP